MEAPVAQAKSESPPARTGERGRAVDAAILQIEKQFGRGSIMRLGDKGAHQNVDVVPTGSVALDLALGVGGVPRVRGRHGSGLGDGAAAGRVRTAAR